MLLVGSLRIGVRAVTERPLKNIAASFASEIRLDDSLHPTNCQVVNERFDFDAALLTACLECFQNGVVADPIPVFEAIGRRLLAAVDPNGNPVDRVGFDPFSISPSAELEVSHRWIGKS